MSIPRISSCKTMNAHPPEIPGYDHQAEEDLAGPDTWICNFEPVQPEEVGCLLVVLYSSFLF